jgi:quercetin 2,3-dioxygenase
MAHQRKIITSYIPEEHPGFLGAGHTARAVIQTDYRLSDPFILLMDDVLDKRDGQPAGGPHPHAGFETVSLLLEGEIGDHAHTMKSGDLQMMTAGSGIVHTETIKEDVKMRLLQLWLVLPKKDRWTQPRVQDLPSELVPVLEKDGLKIKLYSGSFAGLQSPLQNYTPVIIADILLQPGATTIQQLPASYSTFLYILEGDGTAGDNAEPLLPNQVSWLDRQDEHESSELQLTAGASGLRLILYSGQPQGDPIVSHGPFIADTQEDIRRLYQQFRHGEMGHIADVEKTQRFMYGE